MTKELAARIMGSLSFVALLFLAPPTKAQTQDSVVNHDRFTSPIDSSAIDTTKIKEDAPLDIGVSRGLFINSSDGKMQLRLLGSVRYLIVYDGLINADKNGFNTFEIPPDDELKPIPNYFNGLSQSRIGFEITRKTSKGDVFVRLESDFVGINGFRIRHAYGQYENFLFGQTWSLFSHVNAQPATVDFAGPTSSTVTRTPQIRYSFKPFANQLNLSVAFEYLIPNLPSFDSLQTQTFQLIPNFTFRISKVFSWGSGQLSGILPTLSARSSNGDLIVRNGWGISGSLVLESWKGGTWYLQASAGEGITTYFNELSGAGLDVAVNDKNEIFLPTAYGFYVTYEHHWIESVYSNFVYGLIEVEDFAFTPNESFKHGSTIRSNTFWDITEGAKVGAEVIWGLRRNKSLTYGDAFRLNILFYYDF